MTDYIEGEQERIEISDQKMKKVQNQLLYLVGEKPVIIYTALLLFSTILAYGYRIIALVRMFMAFNANINFLNPVMLLLVVGFIIALTIPIGLVFVSYGGLKNSKRSLKIGLNILHIAFLIVLLFVLFVLIRYGYNIMSQISSYSGYGKTLLYFISYIVLVTTFLALGVYNIGVLKNYFRKPYYQTCGKPRMFEMFIVYILLLIIFNFYNPLNMVVASIPIGSLLSFQLPLFYWIIIFLRLVTTMVSVYLLYFLYKELKYIDFNKK